LVLLSIGHFLEVGLFAGRQPLLERQTLVLLGLLCSGRGLGQLIEGFGVLLGLLGQLLAVAPALKLPGAAGADQHQRQRSHRFPRHDHHGTSLKKTWPPNLSVCFAFAAQAGALMLVA